MDTMQRLLNLTAWVVPILILASLVLPSMIRILREYERGVIFRLGKLLDAKGPGLVLLIPMVDRMVKVDLRVITIDVPKQEMMTRDNVPVTVDAVLYFRVMDPNAAITKVEDFVRATALIAQTTLRSIIGQAELDELLAHRDKLNQTLQESIDRSTDPWGVKVTSVDIKDVVLPDTMKRAMAKQAESERERRAKVINSEGEYQAAEKLIKAGEMIARQPIALQLRYLQTIREMSSEHNSHTIIPLPIELFTPFLERHQKPAPPAP
jgi:regulator of protease activity HflC (stomatin/prohibitin superfamily)